MLTGDALRRIATIAIGVGAGPLIQLVATPWLARLYSPADFGQFTLFASFAGVLVAVSCMRYEALVAVADDGLLPSGVWVALLSALLVFLLLNLALFTGVPGVLFPQLAQLGQMVWGIPVVSLCGGLALVGLQLTLRQGGYFSNAAIRSAQTILFVGLAIFSTGIGLIGATMLSGVVVALAVMFYVVRGTPVVQLRQLLRVASEHRKYPLLLTPTSLLDAAALAVPVLVIGGAYGLEATGHYSQILRLVGAPLVLVGAVASQLFLKRSAEISRAGQSSRPLLWRCVAVLGSNAVLLILFVWIAGEFFCRLLLGSAWRVDTGFLLLVTTPLAMRMVVSPVSMVLITHHKLGFGVRWQIAYFVSTVTVLYFASRLLSFEAFLAVYGVHEALLYAVYLYLANLAAGTRRKVVE